MDFLRSLASSALASSGLSLPFALNTTETINNVPGWIVHPKSTVRASGASTTVLVSTSSSSGSLSDAKEILRRCRITRHPDVLRFIDAHEIDSGVWIAVEPSIPFSHWNHTRTESFSSAEKILVLYGLTKALAFMHQEPNNSESVLDSQFDNVWITPAGEAKLLLPPSNAVNRGSNGNAANQGNADDDTFNLAVFVARVLAPGYTVIRGSTSPPPPSAKGQMSPALFAAWKKLLHPSEKMRMTIQAFLGAGLEPGGWFVQNVLVQTLLQLDGFALIDDEARNQLIIQWSAKPIDRVPSEPSLTSWPRNFIEFKVLPALLAHLMLNISASILLPFCLECSTSINDPTPMYASLVKLYGSPDRATRLALLSTMPLYIQGLTPAQINTIWTSFAMGFSDLLPQLREASLTSLIELSPLLSDRIRNNELLRHLAKLQLDAEPSIRTNTAILLARLMPHLSLQTRRKVYIPAFVRASRDTFVHARVAALVGFIATEQTYQAEDIANKVLPIACAGLLDKEVLVRTQANKALDLFLKRVREAAKEMPDSVLSPPVPNDVTAQNKSKDSEPAGSSAWNVLLSSARVGSSLALGDEALRPNSAPPLVNCNPSINLRGNFVSSNGRPLGAATNSSATTSFADLGTTSSTGMKLNRLKREELQHQLMEAALIDLESEDAIENAWGADKKPATKEVDDWGTFELPNDTLADTSVPITPMPTLMMQPQNKIRSNHASTSLANITKKNDYIAPILKVDQWDAFTEDAAFDLPKTETSPKSIIASSIEKLDKEAELMRRREERRLKLERLKEAKKGQIVQ